LNPKFHEVAQGTFLVGYAIMAFVSPVIKFSNSKQIEINEDWTIIETYKSSNKYSTFKEDTVLCCVLKEEKIQEDEVSILPGMENMTINNQYF
jgi:hypothetical protein